MSNGRITTAVCIDSPGFGGAEIALLRVLAMTGLSNFAVLHTPFISSKLVSKLDARGARHQTEFRSGNSFRQSLTGLRNAVQCLRKYPESAFLLWCHHSDSNRWLQLALALSRRRFVLAERLLPASVDQLAASRLTLPLKRFVAPRALAVVVNGYSQTTHYQNLLGIPIPRILAIPNSRPVLKIRRRVDELRSDRSNLRRSLNLDAQGALITCVGRLTIQKGQRVLIEAFKKLLETAPSLQLVLVGDGELKPELEQEAGVLRGNRIQFVPHVEDVIPYLAASDFFALPSIAEGLSGALLEAMASGLPCVTTDIPGNEELIEHDKTGLSVSPNDAKSLVACFRTLLSSPSTAKRLQESAYQRVLSSYNEETEILAWGKLLASLGSTTTLVP